MTAALERLSRMSKAWDEMAAAASKFDGSYERARERFNATQEEAFSNARFIVTACNHHEEAVKLLNECFDELGGMDGQADRRARIYAILASIKEAQL